MAKLLAREIALGDEILRGIVGSTANGTAFDDQADWDELGVFIEPADKVCGLESLDHYVRRDPPEGMRSQPGDVDLTLYGLRRFCRLAVLGGASALILLAGRSGHRDLPGRGASSPLGAVRIVT